MSSSTPISASEFEDAREDALEDAYMNAAMTDFHQYRAKVTGYTPAPNRYFVRGTAPVGKIPTKNWNDQKATVTGYTQPSDQYFATRARLAYHPPTKRFGTFSGVAMTVDGVALKATTTEAPKPKEVSQQTPPPHPATMFSDRRMCANLHTYKKQCKTMGKHKHLGTPNGI